MRKLIAQQRMVFILTAIAGSLLFFSCTYDVRDLGPEPTASFTVTPIPGQTNRFLLSSTSANAYRFDWDKADGAGYQTGKEVDTVYFADRGDYNIRLLVFGHSGMANASQVITVANDDPAAVTPFKLLTGNNTRTWKLAPEAGALWIGPDPGTTWWANGLGDLTTRSCLFNDEYTFKKTGSVFELDTKGDFYVDEEGGNPHPAGMPAVGCYATGAIPAPFQAWSNGGAFTFEVIANTKLKLNGTGAHMALYKAGTPPDAALPAPATSVTYDIVSITATRLVLRLDYGWGAWRFTFVAV